MCREQKQEHRASPAKRKPWLRQTSMAGLIRLIRWRLEEQQVCGSPGESTSVCLCLRGWAVPWSAVRARCIRVHECVLFRLWVCGLRPADRERPGAQVTAGSPDSSHNRLALLLRFIPCTQTPAEAEKRFYLPAAAAS